MTKLLIALCIGALSSLGATDSRAALVALQLSLGPSDFYFLPHHDGSVEVDAYPVFDPITISAGDKLSVGIAFVGFRAHVKDIAPLNLGIEAVTLTLSPASSQWHGGASVTVDLVGVEGNLSLSDRIFSGGIGFGGGISWQVAKDLTDSEFSFAGARYEYEFASASGPITLNYGLFGFYGGDIRFETVPEPGILTLLAVTAGMLSLGRRRGRALTFGRSALTLVPKTR